MAAGACLALGAGGREGSRRSLSPLLRHSPAAGPLPPPSAEKQLADYSLTTPLQIPRSADYVLTESFTAETGDHEDHTFCGIMFTLHARTDAAVDFVDIGSFAVRGGLGPMSVWTSPNGHEGKYHRSSWERVYHRHHPSSWNVLVPLELQPAIRLRPGDSIGMYIHSTQHGDRALVYDNRRGDFTHRDRHIDILPGVAHLSSDPFGRVAPWGGGAWRQRRQFVGSIGYTVRALLHSSDTHRDFPPRFRRFARLTLWALVDRCDVPADAAILALALCRVGYADRCSQRSPSRRSAKSVRDLLPAALGGRPSNSGGSSTRCDVGPPAGDGATGSSPTTGSDGAASATALGSQSALRVFHLTPRRIAIAAGGCALLALACAAAVAASAH